jgi:hypothetical protein
MSYGSRTALGRAPAAGSDNKSLSNAMIYGLCSSASRTRVKTDRCLVRRLAGLDRNFTKYCQGWNTNPTRKRGLNNDL